MEDNSKMDELLKAYAKKRRDEAGAPLELHPATRNLLQAEVKRTHAPAPGERPTKTHWIWRIWPRLVIGGGVALLLLGTVFWFQPRDQQTGLASGGPKHMELAQNKKSAAPQPAELGEKRVSNSREDAAASAVQLKPETSGVRVESLAPADATGGATAASNRTEADAGAGLADAKEQVLIAAAPPAPVVAEPPPSSSTPALRDEDARRYAAVAKNKAAEEVESAKTPTPPVSEAAVPKTSSRDNEHLLARKKSDAQAAKLTTFDDSGTRLYFAQEPSRYRQNLLSPSRPSVLTAFEIIHAGDKIRIIDGDGSVYEGQLVAGFYDEVSSQSPLQQRSQSKDRALQEASRQASASAMPETEFSFRATGTNRSFNQVVVLTGKLNPAAATAISGGRASAPSTPRPGAPAALAAATARPAKAEAAFNPRTLDVKVVIGGTNEFELKAIQTRAK